MAYNKDPHQPKKNTKADSGTSLSIYVLSDIFPGKGLLIIGVLSVKNCYCLCPGHVLAIRVVTINLAYGLLMYTKNKRSN